MLKSHGTSLRIRQVSISPTFYNQFFLLKCFAPLYSAYILFGFVNFCQKEIGTRAVHKMLVKLTIGGKSKPILPVEGTWRLIGSENFDTFLAAIGVTPLVAIMVLRSDTMVTIYEDLVSAVFNSKLCVGK